MSRKSGATNLVNSIFLFLVRILAISFIITSQWNKNHGKLSLFATYLSFLKVKLGLNSLIYAGIASIVNCFHIKNLPKPLINNFHLVSFIFLVFQNYFHLVVGLTSTLVLYWILEQKLIT